MSKQMMIIQKNYLFLIDKMYTKNNYNWIELLLFDCNT